MQRVRVRVIKAFDHAGQSLRVNQTVSLSPVDAAVLARRGFVSLSRIYDHRAMTAESPREASTPAPSAPPAKRSYRRRDMVSDT